MQTQPFRINAAPLTAATMLLATLVLGGMGGYSIGTALQLPVVAPLIQQVTPMAPALPASPNRDDSQGVCAADFNCLVPGASGATSNSGSNAVFDAGRMCTSDFRICREPQNSFD